MTGPGEGAPAGRGHLRAAHADREHVITVLKAAFAQGRLTMDELEARAGQAFAARTYAELAALTADIPADPATPAPTAARPASTPARTMAKAAGRSGICMLAAVALVEGAVLAGNFLLVVAASFAVIAASGFFGYGILDAWREWRSLEQRPRQPGRGHRGLEDGPPGGSGISHDPAAPGTRTDRTRADMRARQPGQDRLYPSGRGIPLRAGPPRGTAYGTASAH